MQTYFETETTLPVNHYLNIKLPDEIPPGKIRIAIIYDQHPDHAEPSEGNLDQFLACLPLNTQGRSAADIQEQIQQERAAWDEN